MKNGKFNSHCVDVYIFITDGVFLIILRARLIIIKTSLWNTRANILGRQKAGDKTAALPSSCLHWAVFQSQSVSSVQGVNMCRQQAGEEPYLFLSVPEEQTNTKILLELQPLLYSFTTSCHANSDIRFIKTKTNTPFLGFHKVRHLESCLPSPPSTSLSHLHSSSNSTVSTNSQYNGGLGSCSARLKKRKKKKKSKVIACTLREREKNNDNAN